MIALGIAGKAKSYGTEGAHDYCVVMLFMSLDVFPKFVLSMPVVVDGKVGDEGAKADSMGNAKAWEKVLS